MAEPAIAMNVNLSIGAPCLSWSASRANNYPFNFWTSVCTSNLSDTNQLSGFLDQAFLTPYSIEVKATKAKP